MISAARTNAAGTRGFTLLELVIVMMVVALLGAGAIGYMILSSDERSLNNASAEVEVLAKRARTIAALQQRPYALEFFENRISLMPLAEAMVDPGDREDILAAQEDAAAERAAASEDGMPPAASGFESVHAGWELDPEMRLLVRRWASDEWLAISGGNRQVWRFDPEGFCEPIAVRIQIGESWKESEFHPLTGSIRDSFSEIH